MLYQNTFLRDSRDNANRSGSAILHAGFLGAYCGILVCLTEIMAGNYENVEEVVFVGHSLGKILSPWPQ